MPFFGEAAQNFSIPLHLRLPRQRHKTLNVLRLRIEAAHQAHRAILIPIIKSKRRTQPLPHLRRHTSYFYPTSYSPAEREIL